MIGIVGIDCQRGKFDTPQVSTTSASRQVLMPASAMGSTDHLPPGVAFEHVMGIHRPHVIHAKAHLIGAAVNDEPAPINPVGIGSRAARRVDQLPVGVFPHPGLIEPVQAAVTALEPMLKFGDGSGAIAKQALLRHNRIAMILP